MKLRSKKDGKIITVPSGLEDQVRAIIEAGGDPTELLQDNQMAKGGMIKRADGSYSRRGLWDNIRANKGSGRKPTRAMLKQEAKIKAEEKAYGGYMQMGGGLTDWLMASGGCMECGGMLDQAGDGKWIQKATASIKRRGTEGVCTGSKFGGPSCPPGSKRYNLAKTFKKMAKSRKDDGGYLPIAENSLNPQLLAPNLENTMINPQQALPGDYSFYEQAAMSLPENQYDTFDLNNAPRIIPVPVQNQSVQKFDPNKTTSIVDYLASKGMKYDKESRKKLAQELGIKDYNFSASKNLELLNKIREGNVRKSKSIIPAPVKSTTPTKSSTASPISTKPVPPSVAPTKPTPKQYEDSRNLQSGTIVDKGTNMLYVVDKGKIVKSAPVLTGQAGKNKKTDPNKNPYTAAHLDLNPEDRSTPTGTYFMNPTQNIYGWPGFMLKGISAYGEKAPVSKSTAMHITYGAKPKPGMKGHSDPKEFARRNAGYYGPASERYKSYGCTNMQGQMVDCLTGMFPKGDTAIYIDSRNPKDLEYIKKVAKKKTYGGLPPASGGMFVTLGKDKSGSVVTMDKSGNITYMNPNAVTPMQTFAANTMPEYQDPYFSQNKLETEPKQKTTPGFRFTGFDLAPLSGGPYAQRGVNYLSRAMNQIPGVVEYSRTGKMSPENLAPFYNTTPYGMFISNPEINYRNVEPYYTKKGKLRYRAEGGYNLPIAQNSLNPQLINQQDDFDFSQQGLARPNLSVASNQYILDQGYNPIQEMSLNKPNLQGDLNQQLSASKKLDVPKLPGEDKRKFNRAVNKYSKGLVQASPAINAIAAGYQFGKQGLSDIADKMSSDQAQLAYSQRYGSQKYSDAMAGPYQIYGENWEGENALPATAYGGYAADGMQIRQIGGMGEPNVEVEGKEHIKLPNGFSQEIKGKSHVDGGIRLNLPQGTQIFSEKLKVEISFLKELAELNPEYEFLKSISLPKSGKISYADLAKKFETKKYVDLLNSKSADPIQMATAQMMIAQNTAKLEKIFMLQEQNKISGVHGPQVQQKAMEENQEATAQEQAEMQSQMQGEEMQEQPMEEQMMAHGGRHLPKFQNAGNQSEPEEESNYFGFSGIGDYYKRNLTPSSYFTVGNKEREAISKLNPLNSSGVLDYAGNLLTFPLKSVNRALTGNFGTTGNFWTDLGLDPFSYAGVNEAKLLGQGLYNVGKPIIKDAAYLAEILTKAGPEIIKLIGKEGVKQIQKAAKVSPEILKNSKVQNVLTSAGTKIYTGSQREEEKNRQIKELKAQLKQKQGELSKRVTQNAKSNAPQPQRQQIKTPAKPIPQNVKPIPRPSMQYTAPSDSIGNYKGVKIIQGTEDFKYGGYLPMYSEAGETKGKQIEKWEYNSNRTKIRPIYTDGTKGEPIPADQASQMAAQQQAPYMLPPIQNPTDYGGIRIKPVGFMTPSGPITEETKLNILNPPDWRKRDLTKWDRAYGFEPGYIQSLATNPNDPYSSIISAKYAGLPGKDPVAGLYQEYMYDYHLDRLDPKQKENFSPEEREASRKALQQMWQPTGSTRYGLSKKLRTKGIDFDKAGYEEYNKLRPSFIDAIGQYRYLEPNEIPAKPVEVKKAEEKKGETITPPAPGKETVTKYVRPEVGVDMALGIPLPQVYGRNPLNYYKIEPQFVEAPVEQPYVNDIVRAMRANITNATDLSGSGLANRQAALATGIGEMGRRYQEATTRNLENRFRADLANAQAKAQTDQFNQQSFMRDYEIPIREREARIDSQIRLDAEKALENERRFRAYQQNKDIAQSFYPFMNMSGDQLAATMPYINRYLQDQGYDIKEKKKKKSNKETTTPSINQNSADSQIAFSKYGGKLKIKPKLKGKFRK